MESNSHRPTLPRLNRRRHPLNSAVTIVLPVHNAQRTLRSALMGVMELAETTNRRLQVAVVDDGSVDATYEIACELASEFPQLRVLRQPYQRGLGAALEQVRAKLGVTDVVAHSGYGAIDHHELADLLLSSGEKRGAVPAAGRHPSDSRATRRESPAASASGRIVAPPRAGGAFRWLRIDEPSAARRVRKTGPILGSALDGLMPSMTGYSMPK